MTIAAYKTIGNVRKAVIGLLLVGASCVSSQASAALVLFNITGSPTASFTLNQSPTLQMANANNFTLTSIAGTFQGAPANMSATFGTNGQFSFNAGTTMVKSVSGGLFLFSGTTAAPTFILGTYSFAALISETGDFRLTPGLFNLSITSVPGGVPEPSTWMMMVAGFGLLGGAMRYGNNARAGAKTASLT